MTLQAYYAITQSNTQMEEINIIHENVEEMPQKTQIGSKFTTLTDAVNWLQAWNLQKCWAFSPGTLVTHCRGVHLGFQPHLESYLARVDLWGDVYRKHC